MPELNNIIAFVALLIALLLALIALIISNQQKLLKIDRIIIMRKILKLPILVIITNSAICIILCLVFIPSWQTLFALPLFIILSFYTLLISDVFVSIVRWLMSDEYSSSVKKSYKEELRIKLLTSRTAVRNKSIWLDFWNYDYNKIDQRHLSPYWDKCLIFLEKTHSKRIQADLFNILNNKLLDMVVEDSKLNSYIFTRLLWHLERANINNAAQIELWQNLISSRIWHIFCIDDKYNGILVQQIIMYYLLFPKIQHETTAKQITETIFDAFYPRDMCDSHQSTVEMGLSSLKTFKSYDTLVNRHKEIYSTLQRCINKGSCQYLLNYILKRINKNQSPFYEEEILWEKTRDNIFKTYRTVNCQNKNPYRK